MAKSARRAFASIKDWREATNTKQEDLARQIGISATHLANIERRTRGCSAGLALKLSKVTNVPIELILTDTQLTSKA